MRGRATSALAMSSFGAAWAASGLARLGAPAWSWALLGGVALALCVRAARVLRGHPPIDHLLPPGLAARRRRSGRIFWWTFLAEGVGILLAANLVANLGHPRWQAAAVMAVVGVHFVPLAFAFEYRPHLATGASLTAWALGSPWCLTGGPMAPASLLGAAAILLASAAWALRAAR
jgi:hypothetical protein